jgi:kynurenine formamidase
MDKRLHSRTTVEPQCKARFQLGGKSYNDITVANLGAEGCCIQVPAQSAASLRDQATLDGWELIHPSLPQGSIKARVVWSHGQEPQARFMETGIQFVDAPIGYTSDLERFVKVQARSNPPMGH